MIIPKEEFQKVKVKFQCEEDPLTKKPFDLEFGSENFSSCQIGLFKLAANCMLHKLDGQPNIDCSIKYQVLSKETAMVGVVKQKKKATGEMVEYTI